jgi:hypothetical protein
LENEMHSLPLAALRSLRLPVALAALITVLATAFAWPASHLEPRDVPIGVTGSVTFVDRVTATLHAQDAGAFDVTVAPDSSSGRSLLRDNQIDGLFTETAGGPRLVLASAGRPVVADLLTSVESAMTRAESPAVVTDAVPPPGDDAHSAVFVAAALPTVLGAIAAGALLALSRRPRIDRLVGVVVVAGLSGLALTTVLNTWLGALGGSWWALAGCYALGIGAILAAVNGLAHVFGRAGLIAAAATVMLLGNPLSGATSATQMLPDGWSALGRALPPGAFAGAVRAVAYYDAHGASGPVLVLAAWALVGALLMLAGPAGTHRAGVRTGGA